MPAYPSQQPEKTAITSAAFTVLCCGDSNVYGYDPADYITFRYPQERIWTSIVAERTGWNVVNCGLCGREIPTRARQFEAAAQLVRSVRDGQTPGGNSARSAGSGQTCGADPARSVRGGQICAPESAFRLWISLGTNDLLKHGNFLAEDVAARMERFLKELLERGAARPEEIRLIVPPAMGPGEWTRGEERLITQSRRLNEAYAALAGSLNASFAVSCAAPCGAGEEAFAPVDALRSGPKNTVSETAGAGERMAAGGGIACTQTGDWDLPLVFDGVHLSEEGHRLFAEKLLAGLRQTQ